MKKKINNLKGFTLIELLAVIVILAIIALIAVPQVLKILNKSRLSAAEDSVYGIVKSAETYVSNFMLKNSGTLPSEDLVFNCSSDGCALQNTDSLSSYELDGLDKLEFKGTKPKSGIVAIRNNGNDIVANNLIINGFRCQSVNGEAMCFDKKEGPTSEIPTGNGYTGVKKIVYLDPTDLTKTCDASNSNSDAGTKIGCMKWYTYADDGTNYTMILDHNTTANIDNWNNRNTQLSIDITGWDSSLSPRLITANEIVSITEKEGFDSTDSNTKYYFETLNATAPSTYPTVAKYGWLFDRTSSNCKQYGCLNNGTGSNISDMYGYWSDTPQDSSSAWRVDDSGRFSYNSFDYLYRGIRPIIVVPKSKIL